MRSVSRREHKLIRKLLRAKKDENNIDWESILFHFPGKRIEELKDYTLENFPKYFQKRKFGLDAKLPEDSRICKNIDE